MRRQQRVASLLSEQLSLLIGDTLNETYGIVTLTRIDLQPDLKMAKVYISCLQKDCENPVLKILKEKTMSFQHILGKKMKMRYTPKLSFVLDENQEKVNNIVEIINQIKRKK